MSENDVFERALTERIAEEIRKNAEVLYAGLMDIGEALNEVLSHVSDDLQRFSELILGAVSMLYTGPEPKTPVEYAKKLCGRYDIHRAKPIERVCNGLRRLPYMRRQF